MNYYVKIADNKIADRLSGTFDQDYIDENGLVEITEFQYRNPNFIVWNGTALEVDEVILRVLRNEQLNSTDKFMVSDYPIDAATKTKYTNYRQYLRDITAESPLPISVKTFAEWDV